MGIVFNTILMVVKTYIKFARYIPSCKNWKAKILEKTLVKEM